MFSLFRKWRVLLAITISLLALLATFYQLYLQRIHNEKSLKPIGQIDFGDRKQQIYIHVQNNGMGPMIIDRLTFTKDGNQYTNIADCLDLDPKSYWHILINDSGKKVVLPNSYLIVFEKNFENQSEEEMNHVRKQLTPMLLKVDCRDIYDNKFTIERDFQWFSRYLLENES